MFLYAIIEVMEDVVAQASELEHKGTKKRKTIVVVLIGVFVGLALLGGAAVIVSRLTKVVEEEKVVEKTEKEATLTPSFSNEFAIDAPSANSVFSFVYIGEPKPHFNPLNAYFFLNDNKLLGTPFNISAYQNPSTEWCFGRGRDTKVASRDASSFYCLQNIDSKNIILRWLDLKGQKFKEFGFMSQSDIFSNASTSAVVSSRDGDSAFIYSPSGAFVFEVVSGSLFRVDLPLNLKFVNALHLSNTEVALITDANKIYRLNFSNHQGGVFDVNFIGLENDKLARALQDARLSKDGRRIIFSTTEPFTVLNLDGSAPNPQEVVAYNIDIASGKVSDEFSVEERFISSCANRVGDKYCLFESKAEGEKKFDESLFIKAFDSGLTAVAKVGLQEKNGFSITIQTVPANSAYFFVSFNLPGTSLSTTQVYSTAENSLKPLNYDL